MIAKLQHLSEHRHLAGRARLTRDHLERPAERSGTRVYESSMRAMPSRSGFTAPRRGRPAAGRRRRRCHRADAEIERYGSRGEDVREIAAPESGVSMTRSPAGVDTSARMPSMPRSSIARARTVAPSTRQRSERARQTRHARHDELIVGIADQQGARDAPSRISALASAIASGDAKKPMCARQRSSRRVRLVRRWRRACDLPCVIHSEFHDRASGRVRSCISDKRQPDVLFKLPLFFTTRNRVDRNAATVSLVGVFPRSP